ncbi:MAG TPA: SPFH domain-containing protein [Acidobacteriota bacterium]|nr:SPFH domain-containing protein [Acidobacteriota bacterium]
MTTERNTQNKEQVVRAFGGWTMLGAFLLLLIGDIGLFVYCATQGSEGNPHVLLSVFSIIMLPVLIILMRGFFTLQPNQARVLILFGKYRGTVRDSGFHWANPFYSDGPRGRLVGRLAEAGNNLEAANTGTRRKRSLARNKISLRARSINGEKLKVNDKRGNPIEIAAVLVWRVQDTAQAVFDVDDYEMYVETQSESALRHLASQYSYDHGEENEITLRSNSDEVSVALKTQLEERLSRAGIAVEEARLTHLAYAPEIAQAMLRRQQAEAVIAARQKIVQGAVSMVDMALKDLAEKQVVVLDDERKAAMVSNLMVVLCGESEVHPVVNAGTLYT